MGCGLSPLFFMRKGVFLLFLAFCAVSPLGAQEVEVVDYSETIANGVFDSADSRYYLRDIRQILGWMVGLQLVRLTAQAWRVF